MRRRNTALAVSTEEIDHERNTRPASHARTGHAVAIVDLYDAALAEAGDLMIPLGNGAITREHILADLHEIAADQPIIEPVGEDTRQRDEHAISGASDGCDGEVGKGKAAGKPRCVGGAGNAHNLIHERSHDAEKGE